MKNILYIIALLSLVFLSSCNEKLVPIPEFEAPESNRVVLIEELTGVSCPNCPAGAAQIDQLISVYGDKIVAVGIHGEFLSWPTSENKYDFRNGYAKELESYLKPWSGKPAAAINRIKYTEEMAISTPSLWSNYIDEELKKEHKINVFMNADYDESTRKVDLQVSLVGLKDLPTSEKLRLSIMILEGKIVDAQENQSTIIKDYKHNHVLVDMLTEFKGQPIQKDLKKNQAEIYNFSYTIPTPKDNELRWNPKNMSAVAVVNKAEGDVKDVLQAAEIYFVK